MLQSILSNIAIILLMHLFIAMTFHFKDKYSKFTKDVLTIAITSISVIAILHLPIRIYEDFWVDMRLIPLVFLAYFQGWKITIPTLFIASLWRFAMGGSGMVPGIIFGMVLPTLLGLLFHHRSNIKGKYSEKIGIIIGAWLLSDFPIIFFMPNGWEVFKNIAFIRGITFVLTSIVLYIFIMQDRERRYLQEKYKKLAGEDSLTKLQNKRRFFEIVEKKSAQVTSRKFIAMLDLDHFKKVNDTFGHLAGDKILATIGKILKKHESESFIIGRYGGEEFIIYVEHDNPDQVVELFDNIRKEISSSLFAIGKENSIKMTVSIGLTEFDQNLSLVEAVQLADQHLYKAKEKGRNCVVFNDNKKIG